MEWIADEILKEIEESIGKGCGSMGWDPSLVVSFPKVPCTRGKGVVVAQEMSYIPDPNKVLCVCFQSIVPIEKLIAWYSFKEEGTYPRTKKMLSWLFESHIDEPKFELSQGAMMKVSEKKGINLFMNDL